MIDGMVITSKRDQLAGSTRSREIQGSCQVNRWEVIRGAWETLQMSASHPWKTSVGCLRCMNHQVFPESKNRMWLMQFPQEVLQCQKRLADVLGPINREPSPHSLQLPANFRVDYSSMDHSKMEDGISLCVLWMWYQLQRTQRDSWTRNWIRTSFPW